MKPAEEEVKTMQPLRPCVPSALRAGIARTWHPDSAWFKHIDHALFGKIIYFAARVAAESGSSVNYSHAVQSYLNDLHTSATTKSEPY